MRNMICAVVAIYAGSVALGHQATAAPLTATYAGTLLGSSTSFEAVFHYDTDDFMQDTVDASLFNGVGERQFATLTTGGVTTTFDSSSYFYERVISGARPNFEFGIRQTDGAFLFLILNGATQSGNYALSGGLGGTDLDPARVTIEPAATTVAPVPLPPTLALFAGSILALGFAGVRRARQIPSADRVTSAIT